MSAAPDCRAAPGAAVRTRVVSLSHSAVRSGASRLRYEVLADDPGLDLTLVVPRVWHEGGQAERAEPSRTRLKVEVMHARLTRGGPAKWYLHHYPGLRRLLDQVRPDVIHLWEEPWSIAALQAVRLRDRLFPHAAIVLETDQNILRRLPAGFEQVRRHTLARTDLLIARGEEALSVSRRCGFAGAAELVEYAVDTGAFSPRQAVPRGTPLRLGYVGRLVPEKGLDDVLRAMAACSAPVVLDLVGSGPEKDGLAARAASLGLGGRVRFLPPRDSAGVAAFMATLDALVLVSRTTRTWKEQFGRVIMEAHACGVPVVGSSSGSIPAVVGEGGWIVPECDPPALAALLDRLAVMPAEVARAGAAGLHAVHRRFDVQIVSGALRRAWLRAAAIRRETQA